MASKYYDQIIPIPWDTDAVLFTRIGAKKPLFSVRIKRRTSKGGYFVQALKTQDPSVALELAKEVIKKVRLAEYSGFDISQRTFVSLWPIFIAGLRPSISKDRRDAFTQVGIDLLHFFKTASIYSIDNRAWHEYLTWRVSDDRYNFRRSRHQSGSRPNGGNRIKRGAHVRQLERERQILIQYLRWCWKKRYISNVVPLDNDFQNMDTINRHIRFERISAKNLDNFTLKSVLQKLRYYCLDENVGIPGHRHYCPDPRQRFAKLRLYYIIHFMFGSLIRIQEVGYIRHRDVSFGKTHNGLDYALIHVPRAKVGDTRYAVLSSQKFHYLVEWLKVLEEFDQPHSNDDFLFPNWKSKNCQDPSSLLLNTAQLGRYFRQFTQDKNCQTSRDGKKVSLNSVVRHSSITRRISENFQNAGDVATMAGTSLETISKSYFEQFVKQEAHAYADQSPFGKGSSWGVYPANIERVLKSAGVVPEQPEEMFEEEALQEQKKDDPPAPQEPTEFTEDDWDRMLDL